MRISSGQCLQVNIVLEGAFCVRFPACNLRLWDIKALAYDILHGLVAAGKDVRLVTCSLSLSINCVTE